MPWPPILFGAQGSGGIRLLIRSKEKTHLEALNVHRKNPAVVHNGHLLLLFRMWVLFSYILLHLKISF